MRQFSTGATPNAPEAQENNSLSPWQRPAGQLLWLAFLLIPLQWGRPALLWQTALAVAVFLAIFLWSFEKTGPALWLARTLIFALGMLLLPYNSFAHTFFIYAGMPSARGKSAETIALALLTLIATFAFVKWRQLDGIYFGIVAIILCGSVVAILWSRANTATRLHAASQAALLDKDAQIAHLAKIAERERIGRDLHDLLGHSLSLIAIKAELAEKLALQDSSQASRQMQEVADAARKALSEIRHTIAGLRSIGLPDALTAVSTMLRASGVEVTQRIEPLPALNPSQEHALAQAVLEAGTNIVRHARAAHVSIQLAREGGQLALQVDDDGQGKDIAPGHGLQGMRERLIMAAGTLTLSGLNPGIRVKAMVPL
jgi:two-component system, NarL family, sensor histidine kinase DesK